VNQKPPSEGETILLLAEGVRREEGNKLTVLGLYPGNHILVQPDTQVVILPLTLLFLANDGEGEFETSISLRSPKGIKVIDNEAMPKSTKSAGHALSVIVQIVPFQTDEFGRFIASLKLGNKTYDRAFTISR